MLAKYAYIINLRCLSKCDKEDVRSIEDSIANTICAIDSQTDIKMRYHVARDSKDVHETLYCSNEGDLECIAFANNVVYFE